MDAVEEEEKGGWVGSGIHWRAPSTSPSSSSTHAAASNVRYFNVVLCYGDPSGGREGRQTVQTGCGSGGGAAAAVDNAAEAAAHK